METRLPRLDPRPELRIHRGEMVGGRWEGEIHSIPVNTTRGMTTAHHSTPLHTTQIAVVQFALGSPGTGSPVHYHNAAWNGLFYGMKRWYLLPPQEKLLSSVPIKQWVDTEVSGVKEGAKEA